jgi:Protein of unknown function (DUF2752)
MNKAQQLYLFILTACLVGYIWVGYHVYHTSVDAHASTEVCIIKHVTHIPCPSCGATRSVLEILQGEIKNAFLLNPLGIVLFLMMLVFPVWIIIDKINRKTTFYTFYIKAENTLRKPQFAILFAALILMNWVWNIKKGL